MKRKKRPEFFRKPPQDSDQDHIPPSPLDALARHEKRRLIAQIVRLNPLDCLDDSGAFDLARARLLQPACAVQQLTIHETTRTDKQGNTTIKRTIRVRLVDKLRALRVDEFLLRQELEDRADAQTLAQRRKLRATENEEIQRRQQDLEDVEARRQEEAQVRAMKAAETRQECERLQKAGYASAPLLPMDRPLPNVELPPAPKPPPPSNPGPVPYRTEHPSGRMRVPYVPPNPGEEDPDDPTSPPDSGPGARSLAYLRKHPNHPSCLPRIIE